MLWRPGYEPIVRHEVPLPTLNLSRLDGSAVESPTLMVGGFHVQSLLEQDIWRRLVQDAGLQDRMLQVLFGAEPVAVQAMVPASRRDRVALALPSEEWQDLIQPDRLTRSFALLREGNVARILVIGPPTEEVWEQFEALAKS